jgi:hypothetical protein
MFLLSPSEFFIIYLILGLISFLGLVSLFSFSFIFTRKKIDDVLLDYDKGKAKIIKPLPRLKHRGSNITGDFREKLGEKVVKYMIEISKSGEKSVVKDRIQKIIIECDRLNKMDIPAENKKIISTVLLWAQGFNTDRHISEIKIFQQSAQIVYNAKQRDFQLRLFGE